MKKEKKEKKKKEIEQNREKCQTFQIGQDKRYPYPSTNTNSFTETPENLSKTGFFHDSTILSLTILLILTITKVGEDSLKRERRGGEEPERELGLARRLVRNGRDFREEMGWGP